MRGPALWLPPPGWAPDPTGRHRVRWWAGASWSEWVSDVGEEVVVDPEALDPAADPPPYRKPHLPPSALASIVLGVVAMVAMPLAFGTLMLGMDQPEEESRAAASTALVIVGLGGCSVVASLLTSLWAVVRHRRARTFPFVVWFAVTWAFTALLVLWNLGAFAD